ncbi:MAG TPA: transglycosylase SLT domain-containing protein, partial [Thermomicrobiales bacterium]
LTTWSDGIASTLDTWATKLGKTLMSPFEGLRDGIKGVMDGFGSNLRAGLSSGVSAFNRFGGGLASAVNWIAEKLGASTRIEFQAIPELATGTNNWGGGWAWVGDGNQGSGAELAYLPAGAKVIPHEQSMALVERGVVPMHSGGANARTSGPESLAEFAGGLNVPGFDDIMSFFTSTPEKLVAAALSAAGVSAPQLPGALAEMGGALLGKATEWAVTAIKKMIGEAAGPADIQAALAFAQSQSGLPYIWGGQSPGVGFDCSGFAREVASRAGVGGGLPRVVKDIYGAVEHGRHPLLTFGFQNPTDDDPRVQHMGIGIAGPGGQMQWFEAGGRVGGVGPTSDYWTDYGYPRALKGMTLSSARGNGGGAPDNPIGAPPHVAAWLRAGLAAGGGDPNAWLVGADIIAKHESGYDPSAVNNWDSNAAQGNPSMGLMQVIRDHFLPGEDPFDPVTNVTAATRYIKRRYGDMYNVPGPKSVLAGGSYQPYAQGGVIDEPIQGMGIDSGIQYLMGEAGRELIIPEKVMPAIASYFQAAFLANRADVPELARVPITLRAVVRRIMERFLRTNGPAGRIASGLGGGQQMGLNLPNTPTVVPAGGTATRSESRNGTPGNRPTGAEQPTDTVSMLATRIARALSLPGTRLTDSGAGGGAGAGDTGGRTTPSGTGALGDAAAVREGINSSFLFTVFGGGKPSGSGGGGNVSTDKGGVIVKGENAPWVFVPLGDPAHMPSDDPDYKPGKPIENMPTSDEWGDFKPTTNTWSLVPGTNPTNGLPSGNQGGVVSDRFPEPVTPHPGHPGWFVGVRTNSIYDGQGNVIEDGTAAVLGNPNQPRPQPVGTFDPAAEIARGLGDLPKTVQTPANAPTSPSAQPTVGAVRLEIVNSGRVDLVMEDGTVIAARIRQSAPAITTLAEGVTEIQAEWEEATTR